MDCYKPKSNTVPDKYRASLTLNDDEQSSKGTMHKITGMRMWPCLRLAESRRY